MAQRRSSSRFTSTRINPQDFSIDDFFTADEVELLVWQARLRVIDAFHKATEYHKGRKRRTENFIHSSSSEVNQLARYVHERNVNKPLVRPDQLDELIDVKCALKNDIDRLLNALTYELIDIALEVMCIKPQDTPSSFVLEKSSYEIWYDAVRKYWQIRQSSVDEHTRFKRNFKRVKRDNRNYHGRNRSQSRARGVPGGTSIGLG